MLSKAGKEEEVVETVLPVKAAKKEVVVEPEDETEVEDNTYVSESRSLKFSIMNYITGLMLEG